MVTEQQNIVTASSQRWQCHDIKGQAIEQIGTELTRCRQCRQIGVGGADQAHVDAQRLLAANPFKVTIFDDPQQLFLQAWAHGGDFVQKQGAAIGSFEAALVPFLGPGEGSNLVAKQFGLQQAFAQGRAVDGDERVLPARREVVQTMSKQLLAGSSLANQQHGPGDWGQAGNLFQNLQEGIGFAEQTFIRHVSTW